MSETIYLTCVETAKLLRASLKEAFPGIKFGVRSKTYSGGASIRVEWTDGPTSDEVKRVCDHFEGANFDGMRDLKTSKYQLVNGKRTNFGSDFIFQNRDFSPKAMKAVVAEINRKWGIEWTADGRYELGGRVVWGNELFCNETQDWKPAGGERNEVRTTDGRQWAVVRPGDGAEVDGHDQTVFLRPESRPLPHPDDVGAGDQSGFCSDSSFGCDEVAV